MISENVWVANELTERMAYPFYNDERFANAPFVYKATNCPQSLQWEYSDRLRQWDWDKHDLARQSASLVSNNPSNDPRWHKAYLESYYPGATLWAIRAGYNLSSGHPYWIYGFTQ